MKEWYPKNGRVILHVDMNSFYASVEMAHDPSLKGKPLAIAGNPEERRGIIVTCSYEARRLGIQTTMPLWEAKKLCPSLIVKTPDFDKYRSASAAMFDILREFSPLVEPVSIDEGYVDITGSYTLGPPLEIAASIQKRILDQLGLPCSIGIAPNKFLAKTASDMKKPMGITVLRKRDIPSVLWPLECQEMHGVGSKTAEKLKTIGIETIGMLAKADDIQLKALLGINGARLKERANGIDRRAVDPESVNEFKSIGNSTTLPRDMAKQKELLAVFDTLASKVAGRMNRKGVVATVIGITVRYKGRQTITRSHTLDNPIGSKEEIYHQAKQLFIKNWTGNPVRLLGVTCSGLIEAEAAMKQLDLFSYEKEAKKEPLHTALSRLQEKYGEQIIGAAARRVKHKAAEKHLQDTGFNKDFMRKGPSRDQ